MFNNGLTPGRANGQTKFLHRRRGMRYKPHLLLDTHIAHIYYV